MQDGQILEYNNQHAPLGIHKYWRRGAYRADVKCKCKFRITKVQDRIIKASGSQICVARPEQLKVIYYSYNSICVVYCCVKGCKSDSRT